MTANQDGIMSNSSEDLRTALELSVVVPGKHLAGCAQRPYLWTAPVGR